jgi:hypothetical protein
MSLLLLTFVQVLTIICIYEFVRWSVLSLFDMFFHDVVDREKPVKVKTWKDMTLDHYRKQIKKNQNELYMEQKTPSGGKGFKWLHKIF